MSEATTMARREVGGVAAPGAEGQSVASLVQYAIERGVDVEVLERLVALQERVMERDARAAFFEALTAFREKCPPIVKTRENSQFKVTRAGVSRPAKYAPLEEIDRVARPIAAECGLVWTWDTRLEGELMHVTCRVLHVMGHSEAATVAMPHGSSAGSSPQQKYGSTQTYGMRYSLIAALGITTADEDVDGAEGGAGSKAGEEITPEQEATLRALVREVKANEQKFLDWLQVRSLAVLPASRYAEAVAALEQKRAEVGQKEGAA
jgi:hypothetical protein